MAIENSVDTARKQIQEAQAKLLELKARVAKAQAKAEVAMKKAKQIQQVIRQIRASKVTKAGIKGGLSVVIASQIGTIRAALVVQVQKRVLETLQKFSVGCPNNRELARIMKIRDNLLKQVTAFRSRAQKLEAVAKSILATVRAIKLLIKVITSIPLPTAIIPPMTGGLGLPVSILTKYSEALIQLNKKLDKLIDEAEAITSVVSSIAAPLQILEDKLRAMDAYIQECVLADNSENMDTSNIAFTGPIEDTLTSFEMDEQSINDSIDTFFAENVNEYIDVEGAQPIDDVVGDYVTQTVNNRMGENGEGGGTGATNVGTDGVGGTTNTGVNGTGRGSIGAGSIGMNNQGGSSQGKYVYKGYEIVVIVDPDSPKIAPRRYAVARDSKGVVMLKGQSSFSSSTSILIDEIKFRIDQLK